MLRVVSVSTAICERSVGERRSHSAWAHFGHTNQARIWPDFMSKLCKISCLGLEEASPEKAGVGGSTPSLATILSITCVRPQPCSCSILFQKIYSGRAGACLDLPGTKDDVEPHVPKVCRIMYGTIVAPGGDRDVHRRFRAGVFSLRPRSATLKRRNGSLH